jgi:spore coat polysaccharide biosynthesis protein SpsF
MSSIVLDAMSNVTAPCDPTLVIGPANTHRQTLRAHAALLGVRCVESPADFTDLIRNADIAVVSFGVTAYELAACRVPALYLCLTEDHARSASVFEKVGVARVVGTYPGISIDRTGECLQEALDAYLDPGSWLHELPSLLDGAGGVRVANRIASKLLRS